MKFNIELKSGAKATVIIEFKHYSDNERPALYLINNNNGEPFRIATVNIPEYFIKDGYIFIKNWSENEGILEELQKYNVVGPVIARWPVGYVFADLVALYPRDQWKGIEPIVKPGGPWIDSAL